MIHEGKCQGVFIKEIGKDVWICSRCHLQGNYASVRRLSERRPHEADRSPVAPLRPDT